VASGPATVTLEDYTCMTYTHAQAALRQLGLTAAFGGTTTGLPQCPNTQFVAQQEPPAGTQVQTGSTVTLFTGSGTSESPSASP
jgi:beta-lactam-binding protein with PASTA domain